MSKRYLRRFPHALRGLWYAATKDFGFRTQLYLGGILIIIVLAFFQPLSNIEFLFCTLAYLLILITELQNSALEIALDRLHPQLHDTIKISKDMAAGAVLIAGTFLLIVLIVVGYDRFIG